MKSFISGFIIILEIFISIFIKGYVEIIQIQVKLVKLVSELGLFFRLIFVIYLITITMLLGRYFIVIFN